MATIEKPETDREYAIKLRSAVNVTASAAERMAALLDRFKFSLSATVAQDGDDFTLSVRPTGKARPHLIRSFLKKAKRDYGFKAIALLALILCVLGVLCGNTAALEIPLTIQPQDCLQAASWPGHAAIEISPGTLSLGDIAKLACLENGRPIPATFEAAETWVDQSVSWLHIHAVFRYVGGKSPGYSLSTKVDVRSAPAFDPMRDAKWLEPLARNGPYLIDDSGNRFAAAYDPDFCCGFERQGAAHCVLKATGFYAPVPAENASTPFARFVVRIWYYPGSPLLRIQWSTIWTDPTRKVSELGFNVACDGQLGAASLRTAFNATPQEAWVSKTDGSHKTVLVCRDFWQRFPRQIEADDDGLTVRAWPAKLPAWSPASLTVATAHQFGYLSAGPLLSFQPPKLYKDFLAAHNAELKPSVEGDALLEERPEYLDAPFCGAMTVDFGLVTLKDKADKSEAGWAKLFQLCPAVTAATAAGPVGPVDAEDALAAAQLGFCAQTERCGLYGWHLYGNHVQRERRDKDTNAWRPDHYRLYNAGHHYGNSLQLWRSWRRTGNFDLLRLARITTDNLRDLGMVRQGSLARDHFLGLLYHAYGWLPWGSDVDGTPDAKDHLGGASHWCNPDPLLEAWRQDCDLASLEAYEEWAAQADAHFHWPAGGTGREVNQALGRCLTLYEHTHDKSLLIPIRQMAGGLITKPLLQQTGALWDPRALPRAYDLTHDKALGDFIVRESTAVGVQYEGVASLSLSAKAFEISGDRAHLDKFKPFLADYAKVIQSRRIPATAWDAIKPDGLCWGPGPLGDYFIPLQIGDFYKASEN